MRIKKKSIRKGFKLILKVNSSYEDMLTILYKKKNTQEIKSLQHNC